MPVNFNYKIEFQIIIGILIQIYKGNFCAQTDTKVAIETIAIPVSIPIVVIHGKCITA